MYLVNLQEIYHGAHQVYNKCSTVINVKPTKSVINKIKYQFANITAHRRILVLVLLNINSQLFKRIYPKLPIHHNNRIIQS